jgi:hypothetical protein
VKVFGLVYKKGKKNWAAGIESFRHMSILAPRSSLWAIDMGLITLTASSLWPPSHSLLHSLSSDDPVLLVPEGSNVEGTVLKIKLSLSIQRIHFVPFLEIPGIFRLSQMWMWDATLIFQIASEAAFEVLRVTNVCWLSLIDFPHLFHFCIWDECWALSPSRSLCVHTSLCAHSCNYFFLVGDAAVLFTSCSRDRFFYYWGW